MKNHGAHPDFPITPGQIADACLEARAAGAAIVHIHVRDPDTGTPTSDPALYREVVDRIRDAGSDVLINLTTGYGGRFVPSEADPNKPGPGSNLMQPQARMEHIQDLRPDICTLDVATMNFGERVIMNTPAHLRIMAGIARDCGVKPEVECFEPGHIVLARQLIKEGLIEDPPMFQALPRNSLWIAGDPGNHDRHAQHAAAGRQLGGLRHLAPRVSHGGAGGDARGHVRVGLEDNLYLSKGRFASNGQLVERAAGIIRDLGADIVEPSRAAEILELPSRRQ